MKAFVAALLLAAAAVAPALADCPVVNRTEVQMSVFTGPTGARVQKVVAPGATLSVGNGEFSVVLGQGSHGGTCRPGVRFDVIRDASVTWATTPRVVEVPAK